MAIQPVVPTRLPRPPTIGFEELSLLARDDVIPHLQFDRLKIEGILLIDGNLFARGAAGAQGQLPVNLSREGLKEYLVFPGSEDSSRVVSATVIEAELLRCIGHKSLKDAWTTVAPWFDYWNAQPRNEGWFINYLVFFSSQGHENGKLLDMRAKLIICQALKWIGRPSSLYTSTTLVLLALVHVDPEEPNLKPDWYAWVFEQISFRLNHTKDDRASTAKFREGWQAMTQLLRTQFLARIQTQNQEGPLLLGDEPHNAFGNTCVQWDAERCELVRERDQLKEDLLKAQDVLVDAAQWEEALRVEHERLQEEYSQEKAAWENKNKKLEEEAQQLHEEQKRIMGSRGAFNLLILSNPCM
ncbi:hypothetical protein R1flu_024272 [Riccia fluitans]|uniref:Aminotransferase-like plant mobile domain-containing protein n=1 Tax=Riccia fluitans TaxID=41844 RepID=A0ABD1XUV1_9MARC